MVRVRRPRMSASEKAELWKRWKRGESLSDIGRALGRIPGAVHHVVSARGGVPRRCCMKTLRWGGLARISRDPPQEPHYRDAVEGPSHV